MKKGRDIAVKFPGLFLVHQNIPEKKVDFHSHDDEHLLFIPLQGEIKVITRERTITVGAGKMVYLPAGTEHAFDSSSLLGERLIVMVSTKLWKSSSCGDHPISSVSANQLLKELLFYLLLHPETKNAKSIVQTFSQTLDETLHEACHLMELDHVEAKVRDERIAKSIQFFRSHLSESISMDQVAKSCGLSTRNFNRLFVQEVELTPKQVLTQLRVEKAKELLSNKKSVTETAFDVGYQSLSQFISSFRLLTGQLPSEWGRLNS